MEERPPEQDPDRLADEAEREADELEHAGQEVGEDIDSARRDWQRKQDDDGVPGAVPDPEDRENDGNGD
jgi:hypothetical protein